MSGVDAGRPALASREVVTDFVPLLYAGVPVRNTQLIRLEVSRSALSSMGLASFDVPGSHASPTVLADVMVGDDGLARAVRFVLRVSQQE